MKTLLEVQNAVLERAKKEGPKRLAVAASHDDEAMKAVKMAYNLGLVTPVLIGDADKTKEICKEIQLDISNVELIDEKNPTKAAFMAVEKIRKGEADMLLKGLISTKEYFRQVINKETGIKKNKLLSVISVVESSALDRLIVLTDCGMVIKPDLKEKAELIQNAADSVNKLGIEKPKVAVLCAVEVVNENMPDTIDAAILAKMGDRGQLGNVVVDGPLAFDNAISKHSAEHKGLVSPVAGAADIMLLPNIEAGNILIKSLNYLASAKSGSIVVGASVPVIAPSRSDTAEVKFNSILVGAILA